MEGTWGLKGAGGPRAQEPGFCSNSCMCRSAVKLVQLLPVDQWESQGSRHVSSFPKVSTSPFVSTQIGMHISECWLEPHTLQSSFRAPVLFRVRLVRQVTFEAWLVRDRIEISFFLVLYRLYFRINRWSWLIKFLTEKFYLIMLKGWRLKHLPFCNLWCSRWFKQRLSTDKTIRWIPGACEYISLFGERNFEDVIKDLEVGDYPESGGSSLIPWAFKSREVVPLKSERVG